jgi:hypothetical protein
MLTLLLALAAAPQSTPSPLVAAPDGWLIPDRERLGALDGRLDVALTGLNIPGFEQRTAQLERLPSTTADAELWIDGQRSGRVGDSIAGDFSLWRGTLEGSVGSDVLLAFSSHGSRGWMRADGELWHLLAEPDPIRGWGAARSRWVNQSQIAGLLSELPPCTQLEVPGNPPRVHVEAPTGYAASSDPVLYQARVAVETDHAFYQLFNDLGAAEAYALALFGAMSDTYVTEIGTRVDIAYLGIYTSSNDPWNAPDNGGSSVDMLYEFRDAWISGWPVDADLAHLVSGADLGGGVAWLGVLGIADYAYAVSGNLAGQTPFPVAQGPLNWDYIVTSHETGHNFGTGHTHNYCPPLDECAPDGYWGDCQDEVACVEGTIMSYCHLCPGGIANVRPEFHPTVAQVLRDEVTSSALRPFEGLETTDLGGQLGAGGLAPTLEVSYDAATNTLATTALDVPAGQPALAVIGASEASLALLGGTLVPSPDLLVPFTTAGAGSLTATVTGDFPRSIDLYLQHWLAEASAPEGAIATNGVRATLWRPTPPAGLTWIQHPTNGLEYAVGPTADWWHSKSLAEQSGGTLAAITSAGLESWIVANLFGGSGPNEDIWLGLTDGFSEGTWYWLSGDPVSYAPWMGGEPNDGGGFEDYCEWWQNGTSWNDGSGFDVQRALYQRPIGTQP